MPTLYLVRHGEAAANWDDAMDPGLSEQGKTQAKTLVQHLQQLGPLPILCSPMARTRETAAPLGQFWQQRPLIESRVAELPTPNDVDPNQRLQWLRQIMGASWHDMHPLLLQWRQQLLECLTEMEQDCIIVTHLIMINAAVGAATGQEQVIHFMPGYTSITELQQHNGTLTVKQLGEEASSVVR